MCDPGNIVSDRALVFPRVGTASSQRCHLYCQITLAFLGFRKVKKILKLRVHAARFVRHCSASKRKQQRQQQQHRTKTVAIKFNFAHGARRKLTGSENDREVSTSCSRLKNLYVVNKSVYGDLTQTYCRLSQTWTKVLSTRIESTNVLIEA